MRLGNAVARSGPTPCAHVTKTLPQISPQLGVGSTDWPHGYGAPRWIRVWLSHWPPRLRGRGNRIGPKQHTHTQSRGKGWPCPMVDISKPCCRRVQAPSWPPLKAPSHRLSLELAESCTPDKHPTRRASESARDRSLPMRAHDEKEVSHPGASALARGPHDAAGTQLHSTRPTDVER